MSQSNRCPDCGIELPPDAPAGVCPKCLLKAGMDESVAGAVDDATLITGPNPNLKHRDEPATENDVRQGAEAPSIGTKVKYFGDYELLDEIARGGMGVVYKARQVRLNRTVALKMILAGQFAGEADVQRFQTEAEAAAQLDHPGIVPIFEVGEYEGHHFFSMGLVEGNSLSARISDGPLPPKEAAALVRKIAEAMQYAHDKGVIHRDLKPANVLIDKDGQPRVTDFGLAKKLESDSQLTGTGQILGTPSYMPPEQAAGRTEQVDERADVYALGAILYCLLTGRPPFQAASPMDTLLQVLDREPVPPRTLNAAIPRDMETICLKCLRKEPSRRYQTASDLNADIQRQINGQPIKARPVSPGEKVWLWCRRNPRMVATASFVALLLVSFVMLFTAQRRKSTAEQVQTTVAALNTTRGIIQPPFVLLDQFPAELISDELERQFDTATDRKLPLAFALAHYGDVRIEFLVSQVKNAPPDESANFVDALELAKQETLEAMSATQSDLEGTQTTALRHKARLAMLCLQLGDSSLAEGMCRTEDDPIERTVFIDECSSWYGELVLLSQIATEIENASLRSALCLAVGGIAPNRMTSEQREAWGAVLTDWHQHQPDAEVHSASGWAMRKLGIDLPDLSGLEPEDGHQWRINDAGLTMLGVVIEGQDFLFSDREISVGLYREFMDDPDYPAAEKPTDFKYATVTPTTHHLPQSVNWIEAVMFCNWLSHREGRVPCYKRTGEKVIDALRNKTLFDAWRLNSSVNGYRLPTAFEWESACRAGSTTYYSFGDDAKWLDKYGTYRADSAGVCGSKLPNAWGLFDMHGNVSEWCSDSPFGGAGRLHLGGAWESTARHCGSSSKLNGFIGSRKDYETDTVGFTMGFRVICPVENLESN